MSKLPPELANHPDYEAIRELGQGGMGVVFLVHNRVMGRDEVLKVIEPEIIASPGVFDRFLREIRAVARLQHPTVTAHAAFRCGESLIFAMEYVEGLDLARLVRAKGPVPVAHACYFVHQVALGLQHAHEAGMVHRDINPGNLMLTHKRGKALIKVLDFGLAKAECEQNAIDPVVPSGVNREPSESGGLTLPGEMLGTPDFIAPEQIADSRSADIRADIYSLGCTLYYLLSGRPPFPSSSIRETLRAHRSMEAVLLNLVRPEVPAELAALVARMMAKQPELRFQTPNEVAVAVAPFYKKPSARSVGADLGVDQV